MKRESINNIVFGVRFYNEIKDWKEKEMKNLKNEYKHEMRVWWSPKLRYKIHEKGMWTMQVPFSLYKSHTSSLSVHSLLAFLQIKWRLGVAHQRQYLLWPPITASPSSSSSSSSSLLSSKLLLLRVWICPAGKSWWTGLVMGKRSSPPSSSPAQFFVAPPMHNTNLSQVIFIIKLNIASSYRFFFFFEYNRLS